ncbi:uncharacterized protein LOC131052748 isoform X2 [Cryptomeria japonica]|uniref:uncharacterized protein LOC131052748 isoform X2 n=1 Tax=Cryptomeria japonica TaxID=3369 RepID=UPI0027DA4D0D|nr:uncharacterized protein LOC131052748 isoform X2 [Cryptomeria japonica]
MASELSDSADITSNEIEDGFFKKGKTRNVSEGGLTKKKKIRNDSEGGFIKKRKAEAAVIKDQIDTIQLSSGEYSQARCLIAKTTNSPRNKSCQSNKPYSSERKDVFLSHSGKQKNFVRQLYRDLTNQGVSCFFDQDRESLPLAEHFPSRIFEAAKTCKVAVLLLSKDFLESKWPMLELSAFVEARDTTNPNLKILPLFFRISPDALKNTEENDKNWQQLEISSETPAEWHQALRAIRGINGLPFAEGGDEVKFRDEIVKEIWHILPTPSPRYHVRGMQGEARMCQEVANFFNEVQPIKNGIRIAGLYGIAGHGKTTLGKAFCNFKLVDFEGRVCHLEFSRGDPFERTKLALQYLTHRPHSYMQTLTNLDQAKVELYKRVEGKRVMLVLDNITVESIEEVMYYLEADFGGNSWILLSARSGDVLAKNFQIDELSCMHVPRLKNEEAITLLLQRACPVGSNLGAENREFALKCANRCLFKEISCDNVPRAQTFHPLAVKAFGGYLFSKYGSNLSKWAAEVDGMVDKALDGLDEVFALLGKAFDDMPAKYRTIFMLLTVYMLPNMSVDKVIEWMAINCNAKITFIEKAVQDLREAAFIEEFEPEIRIHDLYIEFAQSKADKMERWLWWKEDLQYDPRGLISEDKDGFELAKLEQCRYETIELEYVGNLFVLQLVDVQDMSTVDLGPMNKLRSITLRDCKVLEALDGMEKLRDLAWLQIIGVNPMFKTPDLSRLRRLQHLEINIAGSHVPDQLGDLTHCSRLREIYVICPHLLEFPRLKGMKNLEKVEFSLCDEVKGPLDCTDCVKLQTIVLNDCCQMTASPLLSGCKKLSKLILSKCDAVTACPDVDAPSALKTLELSISSKAATEPKNLQFFYELENLQLYNMGGLIELPSFKRLSNLTLLELVKCAIREPPDLTVCDRLENVYFFQLKNLVRFPTFSTLKELKKLSLCDCTSVQDPPDIDGCHKLQVFHLLYNNCMKGLPKMDKCAQLEEIQVSWCSPGEVQYQGFNPYSCQADDDLEFCLEHFKDEKFGKISSVSMPEALQQWEWLKGKPMLVKRYFRGLWLYYSLTAPYEDGPSKECKKKTIILGMMNGEVTPSPTTAKDSQDQYWLKKVEGYFAAQKDIASAIVTSASPDIVENISLVIPLSPRYRVPPMQGEERMCQVVADFFKTVNPNEKGIRIAGLYGMPGQGKTALSKAFCQRSLSIFDGKVCYLEFGGGSTSERIKLALQHLTESAMPNQSVAYNLFSTLAKGQRVLLVLDNVTDQNIEEVKYYLGTDFGKDSCILLSSRRLHVLEKYFEIDWKSCMHVPSLQETEVIAILWERKPSRTSGFSAKLENKDFALKCAKKCSFKDERGYVQFHPLALKAFGGQLFRNLSSLFLNWAADGAGDGSNDVFVVLDKVFDCMEYKCRIIFILLTRHMPPSMPTEEALQWLARNCNVEIKYIKKTVVDLCENAFIEEIEPEIRIHDLLKEFGRNKDEDDILAFLNVKEYISHVDPLQLRYPVPPLQGEGRMCQEVAAFFNKVSPNKKGIRIAGLYGMSGQGKTMLAKAFCNRSLRTFDGKVCYLEFCGVNKLERLKHVLHYLTELPMPLIGSVTNDDEARRFFNTLVKGKTVLLVLDNISEESIDEVAYYLQAELGENSCILLSAQSVDLLVKQFNIDSRSCMRVPSLTETEAIAILWERKPSVASGFRAEERQYVLNCARKCSFEENTGSAAFHPLALKVFSRQLFLKQSKHFSIWAASCHPLDRGGRHVSNNVFDMLYKAFALIEDKRRTIFIHLARHKPPNMSTTEVFNWLAKTCNNEIWYIEEAVKDLFESAFIEEMEPEIRIHELMKEFAQMTNKDEYAKPG